MRPAALLLAGATAAAGVAGCGGKDERPAPVKQVQVVDNAFRSGGRERPTVRVQRGQRVRWTWRSQESHQLSVRSGPVRFASRTQTRGRYERTFTKAGTYRMECSLHAPGMRMTVVVQ